MNHSSPFSQAHRDVLDASIPNNEEGRTHLLEELKNRGRCAVQAGIWPDASHLYGKAIDVCQKSVESSGDDIVVRKYQSEIAILNANLSLTEGKMNRWDSARQAALASTVADPLYIKGWWRLGQAQAALQNYDNAVSSLEKGLELDPNNKALQKELTKMKEMQKTVKEKEDEKARQKETVASTRKSKKNSSPAKEPKATSETVSTNSTTTTNGTKDDDPMDVDEGASFTKSEVVRGYKIVNGKKTSYFHNELSEDAKKLIGDIAPKRLDSNQTQTDSPNVSGTTSSTDLKAATSSSSTSAWNQAGTWEEKDVSAWAKESIETSLKKTVYVLPLSSPAPNATISVEKVIAKGHASVASVRGKKRYIYEYSIKVHWKFVHHYQPSNTTSTKTTEAEGSITFPDVDGTCSVGEPYEATKFTIKSTNDETLRPLLESFVHKQGLRSALHESIDEWVRCFRETY